MSQCPCRAMEDTEVSRHSLAHLQGYIVDVKGYIVDVIKGYIVDVKGYIVDVKGYIVDVKGYTVDVKGYIVDVKGYIVDVKGYIVDVKGYIVDVMDTHSHICRRLRSRAWPPRTRRARTIARGACRARRSALPTAPAASVRRPPWRRRRKGSRARRGVGCPRARPR
eukprot:8861079-Pyramimonas_sp.AAC.1